MVGLNLERGVMRPFTVESGRDADSAAYSANGSEPVFELDNKPFRRNANGSGRTLEIPTVNGTGAMDRSRDGKFLFYEGVGGLFIVPINLDPCFGATGPSENIAGAELLEFDLVSKGDGVIAIAVPNLIESESASRSVITDWMTDLRLVAPAHK